MQKLRLVNGNGIELELAYNNNDYTLLDLNGVDALSNSNQFQKSPFQDGATFISDNINIRDITFRIVLQGSSAEEIYSRRRFLQSFFNQKIESNVLYYENDYKTYRVDYNVAAAPVFPSGNRNQFSVAQVSAVIILECGQPYLKDEFDTLDVMTQLVGGFQFPLEIDILNGIEFGTFSDGIARILNEGDKETPVTIEFLGPVTDPIITNLSVLDENNVPVFMEIDTSSLPGGEISAEQKVIITTDFNNKRVLLEEGPEGGKVQTNASQLLDLDSTYFELKVGENIVEFDAAFGSEDAVVNVTWSNLYNGA